jgi:uncharacterized repeat protein (TIGR01451 family)
LLAITAYREQARSYSHRFQHVCVLVLLLLLAGGPASAATAPPLGQLRQFGVLGGSGVTGATGAGVIVSGDVGSSPTATITNFGPSSVASGFVLHLTNDAIVQQARADAVTATNSLAVQAPGVVLAPQLAGVVLTAGSYSFAAAADIAASGTLTLNGPGVFVFNVTSALTANVLSNIAGTADPCQIFWQVGSDATLNGSSFRGTVITAAGGVTVGSGANVTGRVVAATAVTMPGAGGNTIGGCSASPSMSVQKTVLAFSDPLNLLVSPKAIPGAVMSYTVLVTNSGAGAVDSDTTLVSDPVPANTALFVGDINGAGSGPLLFANGTPGSGLGYTFTALGSLADDLEFSNDNAASWGYVPTPAADGCDVLVTHWRIQPKGSFVGSATPPGPGFSLNFRVCVK